MGRRRGIALKLHYRQHTGRREYRAAIYDPEGKRHLLWLDTTRRAEAERRLKFILGNLQETWERQAAPTLDERYQQYLREKDPTWSHNSQLYNRDALPRLLEYLKGDGVEKLEDIDVEILRGYTAHLSGKGHTAGGVNAYLRAARAFLRYFDLERIARKGLLFIPAPAKKGRVLSRGEIRRLLDAADPQYRTMIATLALTGLRRSELLGLRWESVDFDRKELRVLGKGSKERIIPLAPLLEHILKAQERRGEWVFAAEDGSKLKGHVFDSALRRVARKAKVAGATAQAFRRSTATALMERGLPEVAVQELLGHVSVDVTRRHYLKVGDRLRRDVMTSLEPLVGETE